MARRTRRNLTQQIGLVVIVGLIALAFVFVFGQPSGQRGANVVADVNGESVSREAFEFVRSQLRNTLMPPGQDNSALEEQLDLIALETVLQRFVMAQEASALGLVVTDDEIGVEICSQPVFRNGCEAEQVQRLIQQQGFNSERDYTEEVRRELLIRKLTRMITSPIRVSETTARERLERDELELQLAYVTVRSDDFRSGIEITDAEAEALAEAEPERIRAAYERRVDEFKRPERVRARHILFSGEDALTRAQDAKAQIEAGTDFVVLANQESDDEATKALGGDLGFFPRGRMVLEFEEAAFGAEERTLVGPVETERGQHLIRVEERTAAVDRSVEEVQLDLARELLAGDRARESARGVAEQMRAALEGGTPFREAAQSLDLQVDETASFRPTDALVPGIGRIAGLHEAALGLTPAAPDLARVFGSDDAFTLISLAWRKEPDPQTLATRLEPMREQLLREARGRVMNEWYRERRASLEEDGRLRRYPIYTN